LKLEGLLTEQRNPASEGIDARSTAEIVRIINDEDLNTDNGYGDCLTWRRHHRNNRRARRFC